MIDSQWSKVIQRIMGEASQRNGKTDDALARITLSVIVQRNAPMMWEVIESTKLEPATDISKAFAKVHDQIKCLSAKCDNPYRLQQVLQEAIDKLP